MVDRISQLRQKTFLLYQEHRWVVVAGEVERYLDLEILLCYWEAMEVLGSPYQELEASLEILYRGPLQVAADCMAVIWIQELSWTQMAFLEEWASVVSVDFRACRLDRRKDLRCSINVLQHRPRWHLGAVQLVLLLEQVAVVQELVLR
jgi:hypothetical protein